MPGTHGKPADKVIFIRADRSLHEAIATLAAQDRRSINSEAMVLLEEAIAARGRKGKR